MKSYEKITAALKEGYGELKTLLASHGGLIDTQAEDCDTIWGYDWYDSDGGYREMLVLAVALRDDNIRVYLSDNPGAHVDDWKVTEADEVNTFWKGDSPGYWESLANSEVYYVPTLVNILECIEEYL